MDANGVITAAFDSTASALEITVDTDAEVAGTGQDENGAWGRVLTSGGAIRVVVVG